MKVEEYFKIGKYYKCDGINRKAVFKVLNFETSNDMLVETIKDDFKPPFLRQIWYIASQENLYKYKLYYRLLIEEQFNNFLKG